MRRLADLLQNLRFALRARLGLTGCAGVLVLGIAGAVYFYLLPQWQNDAQAYARSRLRLDDALPRDGRKHKVALRPGAQLERFAGWFPTAAHNATDLGLLAQQAQLAGIALERGEYQVGLTDSFGFVDYEILFPVKTDYAHLRAFIAGVLNAAPHATLAALRVERRAANSEQLEAQVRFTFVYRDD